MIARRLAWAFFVTSILSLVSSFWSDTRASPLRETGIFLLWASSVCVLVHVVTSAVRLARAHAPAPQAIEARPIVVEVRP